jgi:hypothetical protein
MTGSEHERLTALAREIHAEARAWSERRSYVVGSVMRGCANRMLWELGEERIPYEGPPRAVHPADPWAEVSP